ncbi:ferritin-like domain-containing protein [Hymenobacter setariae]|nr:PA2169 family four-helix-bundle protein [Hymenobacter setariae]
MSQATPSSAASTQAEINYQKTIASPKSAATQGSGSGQVAAKAKKPGTARKLVGGALLALGIAYLATRKKNKPSPEAATLDELLYFVNDRIEGYKRAVAESHDAELRGYYKQLVSQSQQFATDLNTHLTREGGEREDSTTLKGKLYRAWMDAQAAVTGRDEKTILGANIFGEEWALKAYKEALADQTLTGTVRQAVERQYTLSQKTYDRLKKLAENEA